jgi:hypothetical protein
MVQFNGHFDGRTIVPDEPVSLPNGRPLRITVEEVTPVPDDESRRDALLKLLDEIEKENLDLPSDLAEQHDHYAHGAPKR